MIYICIPAYNEERTIGVLLWKIRQVMTDFPRDYQILVVDDASTDATPEVLEPYTRILPLTVHRNAERQGYAASLERLIREAVQRSEYPKRDAIITLQGDFTEEPDEIPALIKRIEGGADVVNGATEGAPEGAPRSVRWSRAILGFLLRRSRWPEEVTDPISGFRAYRVIALKKLLDARNGRPLLEWDGWAANIALLREVIPFARRVEETPVPLRYQRRDRPSRLDAWLTGKQVLRFLRTEGAPEELASKVRSGRRRGAGQAAGQGRRGGGRGGGPARGERATRGERQARGTTDEREGRTARAPRGDRDGRGERAGRGGRGRRGARAERPERTEHTPKDERGTSPERAEKGERAARAERAGKGDRAPSTGRVRGGERAENGERAERGRRTERGERGARRGGRRGSGPAPVEAEAAAPSADEEAAPRPRRRRGGRRGGRGGGRRHQAGDQPSGQTGDRASGQAGDQPTPQAAKPSADRTGTPSSGKEREDAS